MGILTIERIRRDDDHHVEVSYEDDEVAAVAPGKVDGMLSGHGRPPIVAVADVVEPADVVPGLFGIPGEGSVDPVGGEYPLPIVDAVIEVELAEAGHIARGEEDVPTAEIVAIHVPVPILTGRHAERPEEVLLAERHEVEPGAPRHHDAGPVCCQSAVLEARAGVGGEGEVLDGAEVLSRPHDIPRLLVFLLPGEAGPHLEHFTHGDVLLAWVGDRDVRKIIEHLLVEAGEEPFVDGDAGEGRGVALGHRGAPVYFVDVRAVEIVLRDELAALDDEQAIESVPLLRLVVHPGDEQWV